ncbi:MAG TPA: helix-turn-helix transcriptional regulator [Arachidicoccus soli]|nr:helix-turn-helix transcriptional regulator [Arachidicoccus soli]
MSRRREFLSLKQEDLAEMAQVTIKTIYMIESGKGNPSLQTLEKIMAVLGLELIMRIKQTDERIGL